MQGGIFFKNIIFEQDWLEFFVGFFRLHFLVSSVHLLWKVHKEFFGVYFIWEKSIGEFDMIFQLNIKRSEIYVSCFGSLFLLLRKFKYKIILFVHKFHSKLFLNYFLIQIFAGEISLIFFRLQYVQMILKRYSKNGSFSKSQYLK